MRTASAATASHAWHARTGERRLAVVLVVIVMAQLMVVLDATIVVTALPSIARALHFSGASLQWVVTGYSVTFGGLLLLGGRAGDRLGHKRVFIGGLLLFSVGSLAGGLAQDTGTLLAMRAVQGSGAALIAPTALALLTTTFPEGQPRDRAMGVYAAMSGSGAAIGLITGGLLTTYASWRWVLFVNVPIGLVTTVLASRILPRTPGSPGRLDVPGAITGTASSGAGSAVPQVTAALHSGSGSERSAVTPGFPVPWPRAGITPCRTTRRPARRSASSCPGGADAILDPGGTQNLDLDLAVAAPGARIVLFGNPGGGAPAALPPAGRLIGGITGILGFSGSGLTRIRPRPSPVHSSGVFPCSRPATSGWA